MELFSDFGHVSVGPSDVIPSMILLVSLLLVSVRLLRRPIYLFVLFLGVLLSEFVALHLPEMHDKTYKQIIICNDDYKIVAYPYSICRNLQLKMW